MELVVQQLRSIPANAPTTPVIEFEMQIAHADLACTADYLAVYREVREEAETDFLESNRALLPDIGDQ
jgi:hypothetical protein